MCGITTRMLEASVSTTFLYPYRPLVVLPILLSSILKKNVLHVVLKDFTLFIIIYYCIYFLNNLNVQNEYLLKWAIEGVEKRLLGLGPKLPPQPLLPPLAHW